MVALWFARPESGEVCPGPWEGSRMRGIRRCGRVVVRVIRAAVAAVPFSCGCLVAARYLLMHVTIWSEGSTWWGGAGVRCIGHHPRGTGSLAQCSHNSSSITAIWPQNMRYIKQDCQLWCRNLAKLWCDQCNPRTQPHGTPWVRASRGEVLPHLVSSLSTGWVLAAWDHKTSPRSLAFRPIGWPTAMAPAHHRHQHYATWQQAYRSSASHGIWVQ